MNKEVLLNLLVFVFVCYIIKELGKTYICTIQENFTLTTNPVRQKHCSRMLLQQVEQDVIDENKFTKVTEGDEWDSYVPCDYTGAQGELQQNNFFKDPKFRNKIVLTIDGIDEIAAKDRLWNLLLKFYGREKAEQLVPKSWCTYDNDQMDHFFNSYDGTGKQFIMKKNEQRQLGLAVIDSKDKAKGALQDGYVVIQEILDDPYLIDGRKTNFRVYVLITCSSQGKKCYVYNNGFLYYSKAKFTDGRTTDQIITTGYLPREVYEKNPLTLFDLYAYLDKREGSGAGLRVQKMIRSLFANVFQALKHGVCSKGNPDVLYGQLYGADVQMNNRMDKAVLVESNKGPSLQKMDSKDEKVKKNMIRDYYQIMGLVKKDGKNGFTEV
jgi:hypothetical protein